MPKTDKLQGLNIVTFESRLSKTIADMIALHGAEAFQAPSLKEVPLENNPAVFDFGKKLFHKEVDLLILLTGVGTRTLINVLETRYAKEAILDALKITPIVPRGPKPVRVLNELGIPYALTVPEPNTWHELLTALDENAAQFPVKGRLVALQEYGVTNTELITGLEKRGARVLRVPVYRWELPDDLEPLKEAIRRIMSGRMHVALFTTAIQIDHVFQVAEKMGVSEAFKKSLAHVVIASVGPDCSRALCGHGVAVDIEPASPKMGPLVAETAEKAHIILNRKRRGDS